MITGDPTRFIKSNDTPVCLNACVIQINGFNCSDSDSFRSLVLFIRLKSHVSAVVKMHIIQRETCSWSA